MEQRQNTDLLDSLLARLAEDATLTPDTLQQLDQRDPQARGMARLARMLEAVQAGGHAAASADSPHSAATAGEQVIGPWRLLRPLGRGGMGEVWLAERCDGQLQQLVAIKRVRSATPALVRRMLRERQLLARLTHPHIARFLDAGVDSQGVPFLVMEYVEGEPIDRRCAERQCTLEERIRLLLAVGEALAHAHRHLIVHRDLKPANVLVDAHGTARLLDFGIAKLLDDTAGQDTETGLAAMTPAYAAPEQLLGAEITTATDIHAFGLLAFVLLTGKLPALRGEQPLARVLLQLTQQEPEAPSAVARALGSAAPVAAALLAGDLDAIVARALRPEPERRYADMEAVLRDLRAWQQGMPVEARAGQRGYRLRRLAWRHRGWIAASALAVTGISGGGIIAWMQAEKALAAAQSAEVVQHFLEDIFISADPWRLSRPGQPTTALELAERGMARIESELAGQPRAQAELYQRLARVFSIEGQAGRAAVAAGRAAELLGGLRDAPAGEQAMARVFHAQYLFYAGEFDAATSLLDAIAGDYAPSELDAHGASLRMHLLRHDLARDRGDYPAALRWLDQATSLSAQASDPQRFLANAPYYRAVIEYRSGAIASAAALSLAWLERAAADPEVSPQWRAHVLDRCLRILLAFGPRPGDLALARRNREQRIAMFGQGSTYEAQSQVTLATALIDTGEAETAAAAALSALSRFLPDSDSGHSPRDAAEAEYLKALAALASGRDEIAAQHAATAQAIFSKLGGEASPPALAARAASVQARRKNDPVGSARTLAAIARQQAARADLQAPRSFLWLAAQAATLDDADTHEWALRQGLQVLAAQGRPGHALALELSRRDPELASPRASPDDSEQRLRAAITTMLEHIDDELRQSRRDLDSRTAIGTGTSESLAHAWLTLGLARREEAR